MKDVFDIEFGDELDDVYKTATWSDLDDALKDDIIQAVEYSCKSRKINVPGRTTIFRRAKGFYNNRRTQKLTKDDPIKNKTRKLAMKANSLTYVSYTRCACQK
jgi:hypothetical protein